MAKGDELRRYKCVLYYKGDGPASVDRFRVDGVPHYSSVAYNPDGTMRDLQEDEYTHEVVIYDDGPNENATPIDLGDGVLTKPIFTRSEVTPLTKSG